MIFKDEKIGIVAPIYGHKIPDMVKDFLKEVTFQTYYLYIILTYHFCQKYGIDVDYINVIKMIDNFVAII